MEDLVMKSLAKRISIEGFMEIIASLALLIGISSMSQACFLTINQPKVPQGMEKYTKEK